MEKTPPYSVLMSLYHKESSACFEEALKSMITQSAVPDEIVIVKDGPLTEELEGVLSKYTAEYPHLLRIVPLKENVGLGRALAAGLKVCRNELVARMDTDDIADRRRCEKQLACFMEDKDLAIVGSCICEFIDDPANIVSYRNVPEGHEELREYTKKRCPFNHMTVIFKKSEVERAGGYLHWFYNEDYYLWIRMYLKNMKFRNLPDTLVNVRVGRDMYNRRGGVKYFKSEAALQGYMLKNKVISLPVYIVNVMKRLIVQVLLPGSIRGFVFKKFARSSK